MPLRGQPQERQAQKDLSGQKRGSERSLRFWASVTEGNICDKKDSLLFAVTKAVVDANAAATFSAPLRRIAGTDPAKGHPWGNSPNRQGSERGQ